ncbi:MAG TPA: DUF86 domain-containing protein [Thermoanaerobaculia bacterium]|nr:DUF86 domain-containing protein [Thermoanaerobaculia bacterium]
MLPLEVRKLLWDVLDHAGYMEEAIATRTVSDFETDRALRFSISYALQTVGEALRQASRIDASLENLLTSYRQISGFRNRLVHGYGSVDPDIVWGIIHDHLPLLVREVRALLSE